MAVLSGLLLITSPSPVVAQTPPGGQSSLIGAVQQHRRRQLEIQQQLEHQPTPQPMVGASPPTATAESPNSAWATTSLSGSIPSEIGDLTELTILYLNGNDLSGEHPRRPRRPHRPHHPATGRQPASAGASPTTSATSPPSPACTWTTTASAATSPTTSATSPTSPPCDWTATASAATSPQTWTPSPTSAACTWTTTTSPGPYRPR